MSNFIFHCVPEQYDLKTLAQNGVKPAQRQAWKATRFRDKMQTNDAVFFYMSGEDAGIYGCGRIIAKPKETTKTVLVKWIALYPSPISRDDLKPLLRNNLLFTVKVGTNFLLSPKENSAVRQLATSNNLPVPEEVSVDE